MIQVRPTPFSDLVVIQPQIFGDGRGHFIETFNQNDFDKVGLHYRFVQDNQSLSKYGTLRGFHFQRGDYAQTKLIRVVSGQILDVVVDLRKKATTFGQIFSYRLDGEKNEQLLVPKGFAHAFIVLSPTAVVSYKCDQFYSPENENGILAADPDLNVDWIVPMQDRILSPKDQKLPTLRWLKENNQI